MPQEAFSYETEDTWKALTQRGIVVKHRVLTVAGYSVGMDMGLPLAALLDELANRRAQAGYTF